MLCKMITREPRLDSRQRSAEMTDGVLVMGGSDQNSGMATLKILQAT